MDLTPLEELSLSGRVDRTPTGRNSFQDTSRMPSRPGSLRISSNNDLAPTGLRWNQVRATTRQVVDAQFGCAGLFSPLRPRFNVYFPAVNFIISCTAYIRESKFFCRPHLPRPLLLSCPFALLPAVTPSSRGVVSSAVTSSRRNGSVAWHAQGHCLRRSDGPRLSYPC